MTVKVPVYECLFIMRPGLSAEERTSFFERMIGTVAGAGGEIKAKKDWGKYKLAFPVKKETAGYYYWLMFTAPPEIVNQLNAEMRIEPKVLRHILVKMSKSEWKEWQRQQKASEEVISLSGPLPEEEDINPANLELETAGRKVLEGESEDE